MSDAEQQAMGRSEALAEENALMREVIADIHEELQSLREEHHLFGSSVAKKAGGSGQETRRSLPVSLWKGKEENAPDQDVNASGVFQYLQRLESWETRLSSASKKLRLQVGSSALKDAACGQSPRSEHKEERANAAAPQDLKSALEQVEILAQERQTERERAENFVRKLREAEQQLEVERAENKRLSRRIKQLVQHDPKEPPANENVDDTAAQQKTQNYQALVLDLEQKLAEASSSASVAQCERAHAEARQKASELKCTQLEDLMVGFRREVALAASTREQFDVLVRERNEARSNSLRAQSLLEDAQRRERVRDEADSGREQERHAAQRREHALRQHLQNCSKALAVVDTERVRLKEYLVRYEKELTRNEQKVKELGAVYERHEQELFRARQASAERDTLQKRIAELEKELNRESANEPADVETLRNRVQALQGTVAILRRDAADYASRYERTKRKLRAATQMQRQRVPPNPAPSGSRDAMMSTRSVAEPGTSFEPIAIAGSA